MTLQLFLNELSLPREACPRDVAVGHLKVFVGAVRAAKQVSAQVVLNTHEPLGNVRFGLEWPISMLRNSAGCVEESAFLKTLQDRAPHGQTIAELGGAAPELAEYRLCAEAEALAGEAAMSLGLAARYEGLALSLASHDYWAEAEIPLDATGFGPAAEIVVERVTARNAITAGGVIAHGQALVTASRPQVVDGFQLWADRAALFPHLHFIPRTRQQLEGLKAGDPVLEAVIERLTGLDRAIERWRRENLPHPIYPFNVRPESWRREQLTRFKDEEGVTRTFSDHADFAPGEGRLHFVLQTDPVRRALVGHVDRKLGIG